MKISILTMFNGLSESYSLVNVVAEQLEMILDAGLDVQLIVTEDCPDSDRFGIFKDERIKWTKVCNKVNGIRFDLKDYSDVINELDHQFYEAVDMLTTEYTKALEECDVCIIHDLLYLGDYYAYNLAIRQTQKNIPTIKFPAFSHSFPSERPANADTMRLGLYTSMDNTTFVYPSQSGIPALSKQYNVPEYRCKVVYNTTPLLASCCEAVKTLHSKVNLLDTQILVVYPGRFSVGKRFEKVASLCGSIKRIGNQTIKVIFCDAPAVEGEHEKYMQAVKLMGLYYGLNTNDMVFTSEFGFPSGFPREGVLDLFSLSNLFICPSFSEAFSLTTLEAAQKGNFLVLNQSVGALQELGNALGAYFMNWDSLCDGYRHLQTYPNGEKSYCDQNAVTILNQMRECQICSARTAIRTRYNRQWVWENQLKPLIYPEH